MQSFIKIKNIHLILIFSILLFLFLFDIGNLNGIRQGTEALYLAVSREMYDANSFLTPLYLGEHHWSKPPFQFWLPFPLYYLNGGYSFTLARVAVALLSFFSLIYIAKNVTKRVGGDLLFTFIIFLTSFGILKFSRTFMMEIPLTLLPVVALYLFYDYLEKKKLVTLLLSAFVLGMSVLVKGPITLFMSFAGLGLFQIYLWLLERRSILKELLSLAVLSTFIGSIWFILAYLKYGDEFYQYFFIRENLGKFGQEKMSGFKIFQGLFLYLLPWLFALPLVILFVKKNLKFLSRYFIYNLSLFLVFLLIWLIPAQKSHHYAIPAIPFFLTLVILAFNERVDDHKWVSWMQGSVSLLLLLFTSISLYFSSGMVEFTSNLVGVVLASFALYYFIKFKNRLGLILQGVTFLFCWSVIVAHYYLPLVPQVALEEIQNHKGKLYFNDRRSYFYEEATGRKFITVSFQERIDLAPYKGEILISAYSRLHPEIRKQLLEVTNWPKWKRKIGRSDLLLALKSRDLKALQESISFYKIN